MTKSLGLGPKSSLVCVVKLKTHKMNYELMASILVKAAFVFGISNMGHVLPLQANDVKSKIVFHEFVLRKYDL